MEKLQEAAEQIGRELFGEYYDVEYYKHQVTQFHSNFELGAQWQQQQSKGVIEELVKALEEARSALSLAQSKLDSEVIDSACVTVSKAIDKSRKNVNP